VPENIYTSTDAIQNQVKTAKTEASVRERAQTRTDASVILLCYSPNTACLVVWSDQGCCLAYHTGRGSYDGLSKSGGGENYSGWKSEEFVKFAGIAWLWNGSDRNETTVKEFHVDL